MLHARRGLAWAIYGVAAVGLCLGARYLAGPDAARAKDRAPSSRTPVRGSDAAPAAPAAGKRRSNSGRVVAVVNGEEILREQLGRVCLARFGNEVLQTLVNKHLIATTCRQQNIVIADADVEREIERMASRFRLPKDQWLRMLQKERGITPTQYAQDIVWPSLALERLAADRLTVTPEELREAYESRYGAAIKARLIAVADQHKARRLHAKLKADPDLFARAAREESEDVGSASIGGLVPPIRRHTGHKEIEQVVFNLQAGDVSPIVRVGQQYAIFKCEGHVPPRNIPFEEVKESLAGKIRDSKLRAASDDIFRDLQSRAHVKNVYNDPELRAQAPGVAATVDGTPITLNELAAACIARRGDEVLEKEIQKRLLAQDLRKRNLQVTQADLDAEIAHAAEWSGMLDDQGRPDVARWLEMVTTDQHVTKAIYIEDAVWPSAALKRMTQGKVQVRSEELQKGFAANYGPRVRCRAIVLTSLRRAQQVWKQARDNPSAKFFGKLAGEYSVDLASRENAGEIPPIRRNSGQKALEDEAFALGPERPLSGIIQVDNRYVILFFEGHTEPIQVTLEEVHELLTKDIYEKKLRLAMADTFQALQDAARIDNYLAGTTQSPRKAAPVPAKQARARQAQQPAPRTTSRAAAPAAR